MPLYLNESQYNDDESFCKNMVNEMYNPINYNFSDRDIIKCDYIDHITNYSYIAIPNLEYVKAAHTKSKELRLFNIFFTESLH